MANLLPSSSSAFSRRSFPSFFAFQEGMWETQISALPSSPTVSGGFFYCPDEAIYHRLTVCPYVTSLVASSYGYDDDKKQHLDNLRRKASPRVAETTGVSVRLGNHSASHFEGSAKSGPTRCALIGAALGDR